MSALSRSLSILCKVDAWYYLEWKKRLMGHRNCTPILTKNHVVTEK